MAFLILALPSFSREVHDYFSVDIDEVWSTIERDLPPLKVEVSSILEE
jgi:uncharacterized protein with HEPN domain